MQKKKKMVYLDVEIEKGEAATSIVKVFSIYDLDKNQVIDLLDLSVVLMYCQYTSDNEEWTALGRFRDSKDEWIYVYMCDFNRDGKIDMQDLVSLFINYN